MSEVLVESLCPCATRPKASTKVAVHNVVKSELRIEGVPAMYGTNVLAKEIGVASRGRTSVKWDACVEAVQVASCAFGTILNAHCS